MCSYSIQLALGEHRRGYGWDCIVGNPGQAWKAAFPRGDPICQASGSLLSFYGFLCDFVFGWLQVALCHMRCSFGCLVNWLVGRLVVHIGDMQVIICLSKSCPLLLRLRFLFVWKLSTTTQVEKIRLRMIEKRNRSAEDQVRSNCLQNIWSPNSWRKNKRISIFFRLSCGWKN